MNNELMEAMNLLEKEKGINRNVLFEAIETALLKACENDFGVSDNITVNIDKETCEFSVFQNKTVVETVTDKAHEISLTEALLQDPSVQPGDVLGIRLESKKFGRIAAQNAKSIILQKIREEDRQNISDYFNSRAHDIMTGVVQRVMNGIVSVNLGKADAILTKEDIIPGETFVPTQHVKVYVVGMRDGNGKGPRVQISRTKANMVRRLFELDVPELRDGIVEIRAISREAGSRTKMAVSSNDPGVDPIGACIGVNGSRINPIVQELHGEKIDIIHWDDNPAILVENALSPAKVVAVAADEDDRTALVVVPDNQLSLAIGMKGQNARLAAKLTGYKIDIKSETQARDEGLFDEIDEYEEDYEDDYGYDEDEPYDGDGEA
ncbi:MAG: transcription termination/antitermination protein NusA [Lachnospiraceae bacterium]|nr:transcription termination/antitermination protein NusA [Lachnospiraceae bacterium]